MLISSFVNKLKKLLTTTIVNKSIYIFLKVPISICSKFLKGHRYTVNLLPYILVFQNARINGSRTREWRKLYYFGAINEFRRTYSYIPTKKIKCVYIAIGRQYLKVTNRSFMLSWLLYFWFQINATKLGVLAFFVLVNHSLWNRASLCLLAKEYTDLEC